MPSRKSPGAAIARKATWRATALELAREGERPGRTSGPPTWVSISSNRGRARLDEAAGSRRSALDLAASRRQGACRSRRTWAASRSSRWSSPATLLAMARGAGLGVAATIALGFLLLLATSQAAIGMVNWVATLLMAPRALPRMDFSGGIPAASRTLAIVPAMLTGAGDIEDLVEALEVRFLANRDEHLHFGLLTDFGDAAAETLAGRRFAARRGARGHRAPQCQAWSGGGRSSSSIARGAGIRREGAWMGEERKRGKLADLNALLRGRGRGALLARRGRRLRAGQRAIRDHARHRYAAAARLGAAIRGGDGASAQRSALRRGQRARDRGLRHPAAARGHRHARARAARGTRACTAREPGIDPYTRAVSDVYQDLFGEGSFIGKGIYDVDAFERAIEGRFPDNRILSHDLLEGCYARSGLLSDVALDEEYAVHLCGRREPPPPLDPRRLAARRLAAAPRAGPRRHARSPIRSRCCRSGRSSTTCAAASCRPR